MDKYRDTCRAMGISREKKRGTRQRYTDGQIQRYMPGIPRETYRGIQQIYTDGQIERYMLGSGHI